MWAALCHISKLYTRLQLCHSSRLVCSLMTSSATSRLRLDFHYIKVDFKKSEVVQLLSTSGVNLFRLENRGKNHIVYSRLHLNPEYSFNWIMAGNIVKKSVFPQRILKLLVSFRPCIYDMIFPLSLTFYLRTNRCRLLLLCASVSLVRFRHGTTSSSQFSSCGINHSLDPSCFLLPFQLALGPARIYLEALS